MFMVKGEQIRTVIHVDSQWRSFTDHIPIGARVVRSNVPRKEVYRITHKKRRYKRNAQKDDILRESSAKPDLQNKIVRNTMELEENDNATTEKLLPPW